MRIAITIAKKQDGKWDALALPDTPIQEQKDAFKALRSDKDVASKYQQIMILTSSGQVKRVSYPDLKVQEDIRKAQAKAKAKADAEAKKVAEKEAKAKAKADEKDK